MPFDNTPDRLETSITTLLRGTKERIKHHENWCQGVLRMRGSAIPKYCLLGAMDVAKIEIRSSWDDVWAATEVVRNVAIKRGYNSPAEFNDADETTHTTIMDALDEAIWTSMEVI